MGIKLNSASGSVTLNPENVAGDTTVTIPSEDGTLLTTATTALSLSNLTATSQIDVTNTTNPAHSEGRIFYDNDNKALAFYNDEADISVQIGREELVRVYNNTASTISKGKPVYFTGQHSGKPTIALGNATNASKYNISGLAAHDIEASSYGYVQHSGLITGFDTSGLTAGQNVFLGLTDGALTNTSPSYPNYPMCLGYVVASDASNGEIYLDEQNHTVNSFRTIYSAYIGTDLTVGGDLTVQGTQNVTSSNNIELGASFQYLNAGDTIGEANTTFTGSGLDDAYFTGHFSGTASTTYYVKIDATGTPDTFSWSKDNFSTTEATGVAINAAGNTLDNGIKILFATTTGHTLNDVWSGTAAPTDVDTGFFTNRNTGASGVGYTHMGLFFDVSAEKWTLLDEYDPEPSGTINLGDASTSYATLKAGTFEGALTGNVTGNLTGDVTATAVTVNGTLDIEEVREKVTTATSTSGTTDFDTRSQGVVFFTNNQTANRTINFTNVNSDLAIGQSYTCTVLATQGSTAYYLNAYQVDGSAVTPKWSGGSAPTAGNASGIDVYTFTIIKTADATFTVLASQTQYA